jgi:cupin fold WbuC family metalloprotein
MCALLDPTTWSSITAMAAKSDRLRQHINVHASFADPVQRLFNVLMQGTYIPPHRHMGQDETLLAVRGEFDAVFFNDAGTAIKLIRFGASSIAQSLSIGVVIPAGIWHTILPRSDGATLFEVKAGPFDPSAPKEVAPWAPPEQHTEAVAYLKALGLQLELFRSKASS